jgi:hypothetical protein
MIELIMKIIKLNVIKIKPKGNKNKKTMKINIYIKWK